MAQTTTTLPKDKLPKGYELLSHEDFQLLTPDDKFPRNYHVGPEVPELEKYPEDESGEPSYWFDLQNNVVKISQQASGNKLIWTPCDMVKLVANLEVDPLTIHGKIVSTRPASKEDAKTRATFSDAFSIMKQKAPKKVKFARQVDVESDGD